MEKKDRKFIKITNESDSMKLKDCPEEYQETFKFYANKLRQLLPCGTSLQVEISLNVLSYCIVNMVRNAEDPQGVLNMLHDLMSKMIKDNP